jgi:phage terminase large subunit-like protein
VSGRGSGKTRSAVCWVIDRVNRGIAHSILIIAAPFADIRDTVVEGPSGFLLCSPPWNRPRWEPSKRRLTWPNGARAVCISGEEPERARGLNVDTILADELPAWQYPRQTWDLARLALRHGDARAFLATTPRTEETLIGSLAEPTTVVSRESTLANRQHLSKEFIEQITERYRGTRFYRQEVEGVLIDQPEGAVFPMFDPAKHVTTDADFVPGIPVHIGCDAGTSRTTRAVLFQVHDLGLHRKRVTVFAD